MLLNLMLLVLFPFAPWSWLVVCADELLINSNTKE